MAQLTVSRDTRCYQTTKPASTIQLQEEKEIVCTPSVTEVSVQAVVERVKSEFHSLHFCNEKLRRSVSQKKVRLQNIQKKTEECCTQLSSIATQVSVDEHKLQLLTADVENFQSLVDSAIESHLLSFRDEVKQVLELADGMVAELSEVSRFRGQLEQGLTDAERLKWKVQYQLVSLEERRDKSSLALAEASEEVAVVEQQLQAMRDRCEVLEQSLAAQERELEDRKCRAADVELSVQVNTDLAVTLQGEAARLEQELQMIKQDVEEVERTAALEVGRAEDELAGLQRQLADIRQTALDKDTERLAATSKCEEAMREVERLEGAGQQLHEELAQAEESLVVIRSERGSLEEHLEAAREELKFAETATQQAETDLSARMESSKEAIQTFYALTNEVQLLQWKIQQAELSVGEGEAARREAVEREGRAEDRRRGAVQGLRAQLVELQGEHEALVVSGQVLENQRTSAESELAVEEATLAALRREQCALAERLQRLKSEGQRREGLEEALCRLRAQDEANVTHLEALRAQLHDEESSLQRCQRENEAQQRLVANAGGGVGTRKQERARGAQHETLTAEEEAEVESRVEDMLAAWENDPAGEKALAEMQMREMEAQVEKLRGGVALSFPDLVLARSHEIGELQTLIAQTKERSKRSGISTLVTQLQGKIDSSNSGQKQKRTASPRGQTAMTRTERKDVAVSLEEDIVLSPVDTSRRPTRRSGASGPRAKLTQTQRVTFAEAAAAQQSSISVRSDGDGGCDQESATAQMSFDSVALPPMAKKTESKSRPVPTSAHPPPHTTPRPDPGTKHGSLTQSPKRGAAVRGKAKVGENKSQQQTTTCKPSTPTRSGGGDWFFDDSDMSLFGK